MSSSRSEILQALKLACSQIPDELKIGEKQLNEWKTQPFFHSQLAVRSILPAEISWLHSYLLLRTHTKGVFSDRSSDAGVRWMALTVMKNGVDQLWRPGAPKCV